jgi:hypothetical protein
VFLVRTAKVIIKAKKRIKWEETFKNDPDFVKK